MSVAVDLKIVIRAMSLLHDEQKKNIQLKQAKRRLV